LPSPSKLTFNFIVVSDVLLLSDTVLGLSLSDNWYLKLGLNFI